MPTGFVHFCSCNRGNCMESLERLREFEAVSLEYQKIGNYIRKQNPFLYEREYGRDFVHFTDEDLMDLFIRKFRYYKPSVMSAVFGKYKQFYGWCKEQEYIFQNPFDQSKYLSYEYLVRMAASHGNVPYYSREYVVGICESQLGCKEYYKAIALSLFEGVRSYSQLARLKWTDIDWENHILMVGKQRICLSEELMETYKQVRNCECFQNKQQRFQLDQGSGALIPPLIRHGEQQSYANQNPRYLSNAFSRKMSLLGLSASGLYESGIMYRLVGQFGKYEILQYLLPEHTVEKSAVIQKNQVFEEFLKENGILLSGRDFSFDFKGYGILLKYGGRREKID